MVLSYGENEMLGKVIKFFIPAMVLLGCNRLEVERLLNFDVTEESAAETTELISPQKEVVLQTSLIHFMILDSILISYQFDGDCFLNAFQIKSGEKVLSLCKRGRGPNEFISPTLFYECGRDVLLYDSQTSELSEVDLDASLQEGSTVVAKRIRIRSGQEASSGLLSINKLDDSRFLAFDSGQGAGRNGPELIKKPTYKIYNFESGKPEKILSIFNDPPRKKRIKAPEYFIYNFSRCDCISSDKKTVFFALTTSPIYGLLNLESGDISGFRIEGEPGSRKEKYMASFSDLCTDGQYVFALYFGQPYETALETPSSLLVFDWNGTLLKIVPLNAPFGTCRTNGEKLFLSRRDVMVSDLYSINYDQIL